MKNYVVLIGFLFILFSGCSDPGKKSNQEPKKNPFAYFDSITTTISNLITAIDSNQIVLNDSSFLAGTRSSFTFEQVKGNKIYHAKNGLLKAVHYDFYYDSVHQNLSRDTDSLYAILTTKLGKNTAYYSSENMTTYSWNLMEQLFDFEIFNNGFSITVHTSQKKQPDNSLNEKETTVSLLDGMHLVNLIADNQLKIGESDTNKLKEVFNVSFLQKKNALIFNKTYDKKLLLSASFMLEGNIIRAIYFDYVYSETEVEKILEEAHEIKQFINDKFGLPNDVSKTQMANSYRWNASPELLLEVYSDGFSIVWENTAL